MTTEPTRPITLLLVDDSQLVRRGLISLFRHPDFANRLEVLGEASSVATAIAEAARLNPDLVLLDLRLPDGSGLEACRQILAHQPNTRILILTSVIDDKLIQDAMSCGAHGYILKEINTIGLYQAIVDVVAGKFVLDPAVTQHVINLVRKNQETRADKKIDLLSPQERRVLAFVSEGMTNKEIAGKMELSDKTVKNYLSNIFEKLHLTRRSQAATFYGATHNQFDI